MNSTEMRITSTIIRELSLFLMFHGIQEFTLDLHYDDTTTEMVVKTPRMSDALLSSLQKRIDQERKLEIETYGWELVGDFDRESELEIVGHLIDGFHIEQEGSTTILTFIRKNRYKRK